jgi:hypothetical protein
MTCAPLSSKQVQVGRLNASAMGPWSCGYSLNRMTWHVATKVGALPAYGMINGIDYANAAECGRCIELTRNSTNGNPPRMVTFTVVSQCGAAENCATTTGTNQYMLADETFAVIGSSGELVAGSDPATDTVTARQIPCPPGQSDQIYGQMHYTGGVGDGVTFTGNRYPLSAVKIVSTPNNIDVTLSRDGQNLWSALPGMVFSPRPWTFAITDVNGRTVMTTPLQGPNMEEATGAQNPPCP